MEAADSGDIQRRGGIQQLRHWATQYLGRSLPSTQYSLLALRHGDKEAGCGPKSNVVRDFPFFRSVLSFGQPGPLPWATSMRGYVIILYTRI